jgi:hypothetical protein
MHVGRRDRPGRTAVLVEGTASESMAAEIGWASESEEEETEEGEISRWGSYSVYESRGSSADDMQHVETLNVHRQQAHASADPHRASWEED